MTFKEVYEDYLATIIENIDNEKMLTDISESILYDINRMNMDMAIDSVLYFIKYHTLIDICKYKTGNYNELG